MATLKEIAERANVSVCTVSRYLNDHSSLKKSTEVKVRKAIEELGYIPNKVARSLKTHRTNNVAVVVPKINSLYYSEITSGISDVLKKHHFNLFIYEFENSEDEETAVLQTMLENMMAGVIFIGLSGDVSFRDTAGSLMRHNLPFVYVNRAVPEMEYPLVYPDYYNAGKLAAEHLVNRGRKNLAVIARTVENANQQRHLRGFEDQVISAGLPVPQRWVFPSESDTLETVIDVFRKHSIDGAFVTNEMLAVGVLKNCLSHSIRIPEEVSIVGFGNSILGVLSTPELTTIDLNNRILGMESALNLIRQIDGEAGPKETVLEPQLIIRKSS